MRIKRPIEQEQNPELWVPDGMPEFKVGDKVRWRISPECPYKCGECGEDFHHTADLSGKAGTIGRIHDSLQGTIHRRGPCYGLSIGHEGHIYGIDMPDGPPPIGFWAAASELIPVA